MSKCESCKCEHDGSFGSGRFCNRSCANIRIQTKEINEKRSKTLKGRTDHSWNKGKGNRGEKGKCICLYCDGDFFGYVKIRKYCSRDCSNSHYAERTRKNKTAYEKYKLDCSFRFNVYGYPNEFDLFLIEEKGWYKAKNRGDNPSGISRDHMISIKYGFENNIDPNIISHPTNCQLMIHTDNNIKNTKCSVTIIELNEKIIKWNEKYNN